MEFETRFRMAELSICLHTPKPLTVEPFFQPYLEAWEGPAVHCRFLPDAAACKLPENGKLLFADPMQQPIFICQKIQRQN